MNPVADAARRRLRLLRVRDTFGVSPSPEAERSSRDELIPYLHLELDEELPPERRDALIDAAVSVALSSVDESTRAALGSLALAVEVLARHAQFARLSRIAVQLSDYSQRLSGARPFLAAALEAVAGHMQEAPIASLRGGLELTLGLTDEAPPQEPVERTHTQLADAALAAGLLRWLSNEEPELLNTALALSISDSDGLRLAIAAAIQQYVAAADRCSTTEVLRASGVDISDRQTASAIRRRGIRTLFPAQKEAIEGGALSEGNRVIGMPTSSGKTFLAELRILIELDRRPGTRAIYLTPYRLLARQTESMLRRSVGRVHSLRDLGGDYDVSAEEAFVSGDLPKVLIMTPERLDSVVRLADSDRRGSAGATELLDSLSLLVIDEAQMVGRRGRGPKLELLLARLRQRLPTCDFFAIAAVGAGVEPLAQWLNAPPQVSTQGRPTGTIELLWKMDGSLVQRFEGSAFKVTRVERRNVAIDAAVDLTLRVQQDRYPVLVLETRRDFAEAAIRKIASADPRRGERWRGSISPELRSRLDDVADLSQALLGPDCELAEWLRVGLAYHHAGLPSSLLREIEGVVLAGGVRVLGATTTVAEGADLPFQVVIVPHLNFQSASGKLDKDLYDNIVGRAGRAGAAVEGLVVVLDSDSRTLRSHVRQNLWADGGTAPVTSRLPDVIGALPSVEAIHAGREVESQLLAWLGDHGSYGPGQASRLLESTLAYSTATAVQRQGLGHWFEDKFREFEANGLAVAASPWALTRLGQRVRLAGLSLTSCLRLQNSVEAWAESDFLAGLSAQTMISPALSSIIARALLQSEETIEYTLWFKRSRPRGGEAHFLRRLSSGEVSWPTDNELIHADIAMVSAWLQGATYLEIGRIPPIIGRQGAFSSSDPHKRAADAAEYFARMSYPAAWTWGAVVALAGRSGDAVPGWIRRAIEFGVPSPTAVELIGRLGISRDTAVRVAADLSPEWDTARDALWGMAGEDLGRLVPARIERRRIDRLITEPD